MSYTQKMSNAEGLVTSHNEAVKNKVDWIKFQENLQEAGGTTEESLKLCSFEDLEKFGLPRLLARSVANIFRSTEDKSPSPISESRAKSLNAFEALKIYDPKEDNAVSDRLKKLSKDKCCIVFNKDGSLNVEASYKLITEIQDGYPERDNYPLDGEPVRIYKVGEKLEQFADENPLYPGRLLRPDGTCDQTNRSWDGVSLEVRQLIYLAIQSKEVEIRNINDAHNILDICLDSSNLSKFPLRHRFTKAAIKFTDLERRGSLPTLKISKKVSETKFHGGLRI